MSPDSNGGISPYWARLFDKIGWPHLVAGHLSEPPPVLTPKQRKLRVERATRRKLRRV